MSISAQAAPKRQAFGRIVEDQKLAEALDFLRDSARAIGEARGRLVKAESYIKHVEALLMLQSQEKSIEGRKADARMSQKWLDATNEESLAAIEFETLKASREAASAAIETWRSEQANYRGMKV